MMNITKKFTNIKPMYLLMGLIMIAVAVVIPLQRKNVDKFADAATETYLMGDVDLSGQIEPSDARTVLRVSVKLEDLEGVKDCAVLPNSKSEPTKGQLADIDGDGQITPADARAVLRMSVMLEEQKTIEVTIEEPSTEPTSSDVEPTTENKEFTKEQMDELNSLINKIPDAGDRLHVQTGVNLAIKRGLDFEDVRDIAVRLVAQYSGEEVSVTPVETSTEKQGLTEKEIQELRDYAHTLLGYQQENDSRRDKVINAHIQSCIEKGMTFEEAKKHLTETAKARELPPEETEPVTYDPGEFGEICRWCGKETEVYPDGTRSCYCTAWITDQVCPGCGQLVKGMTQHVCKAYWDWERAEDLRIKEEQSKYPNPN